MTDEELKKAVEMLKDGKVPSRYLTELRDLGLVSVQYGKIVINRQAVERAWRILSAYL